MVAAVTLGLLAWLLSLSAGPTGIAIAPIYERQARLAAIPHALVLSPGLLLTDVEHGVVEISDALRICYWKPRGDPEAAAAALFDDVTLDGLDAETGAEILERLRRRLVDQLTDELRRQKVVAWDCAETGPGQMRSAAVLRLVRGRADAEFIGVAWIPLPADPE
ncbi:MAG: hypothetical protein AAF183_24145 [Pseudomonadota bacterium]